MPPSVLIEPWATSAACWFLLAGCCSSSGIILILAGKVNLPIGRLPGDIVYRGKNTTFYFPLVTSILLSVILSLVLVCRESDAAVRPLFAVRSSLFASPSRL